MEMYKRLGKPKPTMAEGAGSMLTTKRYSRRLYSYRAQPRTRQDLPLPWLLCGIPHILNLLPFAPLKYLALLEIPGSAPLKIACA